MKDSFIKLRVAHKSYDDIIFLRCDFNGTSSIREPEVTIGDEVVAS